MIKNMQFMAKPERMDAALDGIALTLYAGLPLIVEDVSENPVYNTQGLDKSAADGTFMQSNSRERLEIKLRVYAKTRSSFERTQAYARLCEWCGSAAAEEKKLTVAYRRGQFLSCVCTKMPELTSSTAIDARFEITLTAYEMPYWRTEERQYIQKLDCTANANKSATVDIGGAKGMTDFADVVATVKSGTLTRITIGAAKSSITYTGLSIPSGQSFIITHDRHGTFSAKDSRGNMLGAFRTPASSDDLLVRCGEKETFTVNASARIELTVSGCGRWA